MFHANRNDKKAGISILTSDKIDFKTKAITKDKKGHYILIKESIQGEDLTLVNIYALNIQACKCVKQIVTDLNGQMCETNTNRHKWKKKTRIQKQ